MNKKRIIIGFIISFSILFIFGCGKSGGNFVGNAYINKSMAIRIIPPAGWAHEEKRNSIYFYSPIKEQARIRIVMTNLGIISRITSGSSPLPSKAFIKGCKIGIIGPTKGGGLRGQLTAEGKTTFNGNPAYEMSFIHKGKTNVWESKCFLSKIGTAYYEVSYFVTKDSDYTENLALIEKSLETLKFNPSQSKGTV